jgi:hypothetical protein
MSRALNVSLTEAEVLAKCGTNHVGVSAIETLPEGGVRLVCMSTDGADQMRRKFRSHLIKGEVVRERHRPRRPLW